MEGPAQGMEETQPWDGRTSPKVQGPTQGMEGRPQGMEYTHPRDAGTCLPPHCQQLQGRRGAAQQPRCAVPAPCPPTDAGNMPPAFPQVLPSPCPGQTPPSAGQSIPGQLITPPPHTHTLSAAPKASIPNDKRTNISLSKPNYLAAIFTEREPRGQRGRRWKALGYTTQLLISRPASVTGAAPSSPAHPHPPSSSRLTHRKGHGDECHHGQPPAPYLAAKTHRLGTDSVRAGGGRCWGDTAMPVPYNQQCPISLQPVFPPPR